jgi:hypothetical protein
MLVNIELALELHHQFLSTIARPQLSLSLSLSISYTHNPPGPKTKPNREKEDAHGAKISNLPEDCCQLSGNPYAVKQSIAHQTCPCSNHPILINILILTELPRF